MRQLPNPMTLTLALFSLLALSISFLVLVVNLRTAQDGHEDETGFHAVPVSAQDFRQMASDQVTTAASSLAKMSARQAAA